MPLNKQLNPKQTGAEAERLHSELHKRIVGQNDAVDQIVSIYQTFLAGLTSPGRPIGNFLFLGPTGSGKTRLVEATAESSLGDPRAVIKVDCAEFQHSHEIAKLIGSPPGYLGHRETHPLLSQEVLNQHHTDKFKVSFVLFDEIEKASDSLWNLLLGILEKATLTLGDNRRVDFSRAMIFMTSNLGASEMDSILRPKLGFGACKEVIAAAAIDQKIARSAVEAARKKFTPEFMNRIDKIVVFHPLCQADLAQILEIELGFLQQRVLNSTSGAPFIFSLAEPAKAFLLREGTDVKYGARHLKRVIERELVHPLSNLVASEQISSGDLIQVSFDAEAKQLTFVKEEEGVPAYEMVQRAAAGAGPSGGRPAQAAETPTPRAANARSTKR